ncbi:MAG: hypothetical protein HC846_06395 [Blastocatellia bacterium]|nr:hypothetical protein [Blastocatellia bacterium]
MSIENENPESEQLTPEEYLAKRKTSVRKTSWWAVGIGGFLVIAHLSWLILFALIGIKTDFSILFRSILFILGLVGFIGGIWGLYYAKSLNLNDIIPTEAAIKYLEQAREITPYYTYILVVSIVLVLSFS